MSEINLDNIKPNSHVYKQEETKREEPKLVVERKDIVTTKKPFWKKMVETFINTDKEAIKEWLIWEAIIPGIQEIGQGLLEVIFYKDSGRSRRGYRKRGSEMNYRSFYKKDPRERLRETEEEEYDYKNIVLRTKSVAEDLLDEIYDRIERTGELSVSELLDMVGEESKYTDTRYGWTSTRSFGLKKVREGWLLDVTNAKYLS